MVRIGYTLLGEQAGPKDLVANAVAAERAGFDLAVASDHYFPWLDVQGPPHSCGPPSAPWLRRPSASS